MDKLKVEPIHKPKRHYSRPSWKVKALAAEEAVSRAQVKTWLVGVSSCFGGLITGQVVAYWLMMN